MNALLLKLLLPFLVINILPRLIRALGAQAGGMLASFPIVGGTLVIILSVGKSNEQLILQMQTSLAGLGAGACSAFCFAVMTNWGKAPRGLIVAMAAAVFFPCVQILRCLLPSTLPAALACVGGLSCALGCIAQAPLTLSIRKDAITMTRSAKRIILVLRQIVPLTFVAGSSLLSSRLEAHTCGLIAAFPLMSWLTLSLTLWEQGRKVAQPMAAAYPLGNLSAIGFYGTFGLTVDFLGMPLAASCSLLAAVGGSWFGWNLSRLVHEIRAKFVSRPITQTVLLLQPPAKA